MADRPLTDRDLLGMLRRHYLPENRPAAGVFAPEIESPDRKRRADLIWMPVTTAADGKGIVGHEIKVSRADVINELADRLKADAWIRHCRQWYLVVADPRLVDGLDIPDQWGIMAPPSGRRTRSMTIVRKAPLLLANDLEAAYERIARWLHWKTDEAIRTMQSRARYEEDQRKRIDELQQQLREMTAKLRTAGVTVKTADPLDEAVRAIVDGLGARPFSDQLGAFDAPIEVEDVITALKDLGETRQQAKVAESALARAQQTAGHLAAVLDRVAKGAA